MLSVFCSGKMETHNPAVIKSMYVCSYCRSNLLILKQHHHKKYKDWQRHKHIILKKEYIHHVLTPVLTQSEWNLIVTPKSEAFTNALLRFKLKSTSADPAEGSLGNTKLVFEELSIFKSLYPLYHALGKKNNKKILQWWWRVESCFF